MDQPTIDMTISPGREHVTMETQNFASLHPGPQKFIQVCESGIVPVILIVAICTNIICLFILPRTKITNSFKTSLVALTLSDLFNAVFGFSQMLLEIICFDGDMPFGFYSRAAVATYSLYFISNTFLGISASIVISIVCIRHAIVTRPLTSRKSLTSKRIKIISCCLFVANFVLVAPTVFTVVWQSCYKSPDEPTCNKWNSSVPNFESVAKYYPYTLTVFYGPVMVIIYIICFAGIHSTLKKANEDMNSMIHRKISVQATKIRVKRTSRTTRTLLFILVLDIICLIPICVQGLAIVIAPKKTVFSETNAPYKIFDTVGEVITAMRPAYNFWLYVFTQREFRYIVKSVCCRKPAKKEQSKELSSGQRSTCTTVDALGTGTPTLMRGQVILENSLQLTDDEWESVEVHETKM